jgi:hypothetical protein
LPRALACLAVLALLVTACGVGQKARGGPATLLLTHDFGERIAAEGEAPSGRALDSFARGRARFVNGVAARGDTTVHGGDRVWSDRNDARTPTPAVVGSFPEPFLHGIDGKRLPVRVECADARGAACRRVADRLAAYDVPAARGGLQTARAAETLRLLVGPWTELRPDPAVSGLERGPGASGVYARIAPDGRSIALLDATGRVTRTLGAGSGLVAATKRPDERPTWVVTGTDAAGVASAVRAFEEGTLEHRFALAVSDDLPVALPDGG